ncbi:DUF2325 domain-containing protein [Desulfovibrio litoralis]|uniref:DUF2325 domain-containing protein n=1 Tax=Desulfovibrio litoralis DSM 11393 TaxID=1121455 RepID=A0A1M7SYS7_9BACT|nr:DUF2325 domain-containing protein [Desulfovibrio litoralis]SHN63665.1 hypothetical protein SAMN02745728_01394 [Desulfovibrio litoralis DSM 11393]
MSIVLIGGIENQKSNYIKNAQKIGINLKVFTGHERNVGSRIGKPDAVIILTKVISHVAKQEVSQKAKTIGVGVVYQKLTGLNHLQACFQSLIKDYKKR